MAHIISGAGLLGAGLLGAGLGRAGIGLGGAGIGQQQAHLSIRDGRDNYRPKEKTIREKLQSEINEWLEPVRTCNKT